MRSAGSRHRVDYTTIGHVTIDVLEDGERQPGGGAFYSALQAARLGARARIVTSGDPAEIRAALAPYLPELELEVIPAASTTSFLTRGSGAGRVQRVLAWAGPLPPDIEVDTGILHIAPVAREAPTGWRGEAGFVGMTPQGLARVWGEDGEIELARHEPGSEHERAAQSLARRCQAIVVSEVERASCAHVIDAAREAGATVAITAGPRPSRIIRPDGSSVAVGVAPLAEPIDDLGAGDVFAAAFFLALADGKDPEEAAAFAGAAAAVRMGGRGPQAVGTHEAIDARLRDTETAIGL